MTIDASNIPKVLVLILPGSEAPNLERLLREKNARHFVLLNARGTVTSELIDMLGLSDSEKNFYFCVAPKTSIATLMTAVTERFELKKPGHGIAFVLPISSMSAILASAVIAEMGENTGAMNDFAAMTAVKSMRDGFANRRTSERKRLMDDDTNTERFELILSIVNQGFSDELMDAARGAGAQGGTVFHARGTARPEEEKFYGISIQHEKEIVAIVARKAQRRAILDAVQEACGKDSEASGVFLALPVEECVGVG
ncbi:MAG: hypothetical protein LBH56_04060 [Coriobacteriales bacterium]|jgi:nitrogen regulatory protein PII|nr:hypothetical protein [Coriobacteriales bacterium]